MPSPAMVKPSYWRVVTQPQKRSGGSTEVPKATARVGPYSTRTPSSSRRSPWVRASSAIPSQSTTRPYSTRACRHRSHYATATARGSPPMLGRRNTSGATATPGPAHGLTAPAHTPWSQGASTRRVWPSKTLLPVLDLKTICDGESLLLNTGLPTADATAWSTGTDACQFSTTAGTYSVTDRERLLLHRCHHRRRSGLASF